MADPFSLFLCLAFETRCCNALNVIFLQKQEENNNRYRGQYGTRKGSAPKYLGLGGLVGNGYLNHLFIRVTNYN